MRAKLGDIFEISSGGTPSKSHPEYYGGDIPWVKTGDLKKEYLYEVEDFITEEGLKNSSAKMYESDTVLIAMYGATIGATSILKMNACTNQACAAFKKNEQVIPEYLYYFLRSQKDKFVKDGVGGAQPNISAGYLKKVEMELPSIDEQRIIVNILDKISNIIVNRNQEMISLDDLIKARFVEMFGDVIHNSKKWQVCLFAEITSSRLGKMLDAKQQTGRNSYPYLANFNVQWFRFNLENLNKMDFDEKDRAEFELREGDLLVCEGGEIGRCAVWHNELQPCFFQKALHRVRCNHQIILPDYLAWWFRYNCDYGGFSALAGAKATIAHLPGAKLKQLQVAVPPMELQEQFAVFVAQTDKSKVAVQKALDEAQLLFDSLMQEYFG